MADEFPYHADGASYVCNCCGKPIPDGVNMLGTWSPDGTLIGTRGLIDDKQVHRCGEYLQIDVTLATFDLNNGQGASDG